MTLVTLCILLTALWAVAAVLCLADTTPQSVVVERALAAPTEFSLASVL